MSTVTAKLVTFHLHVGNHLQSHEMAKAEHLDPLGQYVIQLAEGVKQVTDELDYLKIRERAHRDTNESTNSRIAWWSLFEYAVLIGMGTGQLYMLQSFFENKRGV